MRTTVNLDDELLQAAKLRARDRGLTLGEVLEDALRRTLTADDSPASKPEVPLFTYGSGLRPGVDLSSNRAISELLDDGDLDRLS
jgi:hypothetical protein